MAEADIAEFPVLFVHSARLAWGVSVLSGERDGKRRYLFEDGEERTMAAAHQHLMQRVDRPDRGQQATYARLMALLAKREGREPAGAAVGMKAIIAQVESFRVKYPAGFSSEAWQADERNLRVREACQAVQRALSAAAMEKLARANRLEGVWSQVVTLVGESGLVPEPLGAPSSIGHQRLLGEGVRDLLHGTDHFERRFDRFVMCHESVFQKFPDWPAATALPALMSPVEHVCVDPATFRSQLKALSRPSTLGARPSSRSYARCRSMARALASSLATQGEVPRDLLEVHAFIRATLKPARKAGS